MEYSARKDNGSDVMQMHMPIPMDQDSSFCGQEGKFVPVLVPKQVRFHSTNNQGFGRKRKRNPLDVNTSSPLAMITRGPANHDENEKTSRSVQCHFTASLPIPCKEQRLELARAKLEHLKQKQRDIGINQTGCVPCVPLQEDPKIGSKTFEDVQVATTSENVQVALKRAREKLQGAMQKRDRAMQRLSPLNVAVTPISALSANLVIENIAETGPQDKVFFPSVQTTLESSACGDISHSLSERKLHLQQELQTLKEKLDKYQKENESCFTEEKHKIQIKHSLTKEELEKKKEEAQTIMDLSHWKHFVSKQENMLEEASRRVAENQHAIMESEAEQEETENELQTTQEELTDLENREKAVSRLLKSTTCRLLRTRKDLYDAKGKKVTEI